MGFKRLCTCFFTAAALCAGALAAPGEWVAGVEAGLARHSFNVMYTYPPPDTDSWLFADHAHGLDIGFFGEYRLSLAGPLKLGARARVSWQRATWKLHYTDSEEDSQLRFSVPFSYAFSLVPRVKIPGGPDVFVELGIGQSRVKETRDSVNYPGFDYSGTPFTQVLGAGLGFRILPRVGLELSVRKTFFSRFSYSSSWADGSLIELITDRPASLFVGAGLTIKLK